jgi:hypothetical protein
VVGKKSLAAGGVEVSHRKTPGEKQTMGVDAAVDHVVRHVRAELERLAKAT